MRKRSQIYLVNENEDYGLSMKEEKRREKNDFVLMYYYIIRWNHIKAIHVANNSK